MSANDNSYKIDITLGGETVSVNVTSDEESMFRNAAKEVTKRVNEYKKRGLFNNYGEQCGLQLVALSFLIDKLRLQNANNGIRGIRERIEQAGGSVRFSTSPGEGFLTRFQLPVSR